MQTKSFSRIFFYLCCWNKLVISYWPTKSVCLVVQIRRIYFILIHFHSITHQSWETMELCSEWYFRCIIQCNFCHFVVWGLHLDHYSPHHWNDPSMPKIWFQQYITEYSYKLPWYPPPLTLTHKAAKQFALPSNAEQSGEEMDSYPYQGHFSLTSIFTKSTL